MSGKSAPPKRAASVASPRVTVLPFPDMASHKNKVQAAIELAAVKGILWLVNQLPYRSAQRLGGRLGVLFHDLFRVRVKHARAELLRCFPDKTEEWAARTVREVYRNFGSLAIEQALMRKIYPEISKYVHYDQPGIDLLYEKLAREKGLIVVSGHIGNWENAMGLATSMGIKVTGVAGHQSNKGIDDLIDKHRKAVGIEVLKRGDAAKGVIKALRENHVNAIMIDQDAGSEGVFVPFFGRLASTTRGAATLSLKLDVPLLFMQTWRDERGDIQVRFLPVDFTPTGQFEQDVVNYTAAMTAQLEGCVRQHPEQWLWLHRRWKTRPPEERS